MGLKSLLVIFDILGALLLTAVLYPILLVLGLLRKIGVFKVVQIAWFLIDTIFGMMGALLLIAFGKFVSLFENK